MIDNTAISSSKNGSSDIEPLVSVLVPSYNHEKYVIECLESIKNSKYKRIELILSDDHSSDSTYELASQWTQLNAERFERAIAIRQDKNLGVVSNLQFLFDRSQGDYLAYIASDDLLVESGIPDRLRLLQSNGNVDAVFGNSQLISASGAVLQDPFVPPHIAKTFCSPRLLTCALLRYWGLGGPVMMLRREAVLRNGSLGILPNDLKFEDRYIFIRLAAQGKLMFLNTVVAKYRVVENSMSRSSSFSSIEAIGVVESDKRNRHLLSGIDRLFIEVAIATNNIELNSTETPMYSLIKQFYRIASGLLWRALYIQKTLKCFARSPVA
jgi:glycosyltransferase involved in cell wall biosynthesis